MRIRRPRLDHDRPARDRLGVFALQLPFNRTLTRQLDDQPGLEPHAGSVTARLRLGALAAGRISPALGQARGTDA